MLSKVITYTDYDGHQRSETFYFNLSKAELYELEATTPGGMEKYIKRMTEEEDREMLFNFFKKIITMSFGKKSLDGNRFVKKENGVRLVDEFMETEAYTVLLEELLGSAEGAANFVNAIIPHDLSENQIKNGNNVVAMEHSNVVANSATNATT